jgi:hypothetical protein
LPRHVGPPRVVLDVDYAVACLSGRATITLTAEALRLGGVLEASVVRERILASLDGTKVELEGVRLDLVGLPSEIIDVIDRGEASLDTGELEALVSFASTRLIAALGDLLGALPLPLPVVGCVSVREGSAHAEPGYLVLQGILE